MMIDAHAHIGHFWKYAPIYPTVRTTEGMVKVMDRFGIDRACVSSLRAMSGFMVQGNLEVKNEVGEFPDRFIPFCSINSKSSKAPDELKKCLGGWGWKGIYLHDIHYLDQDYSDFVFEAAEEYGVPVMVLPKDLGALGWPMITEYEADNIAKMAGKFPKVTVIFAHMGWFSSDIACNAAKRHSNIVLDTTHSSSIQNIEPVVKAIGAERVVFGTGLPLMSPGPNISKVRDAKITEGDKRLIMGENMKRILKL